MSRALPRTENFIRRAAAVVCPAADRGIVTRLACVKLVRLFGRLACGLLAAMHIAPLLRVSRHVLEQGPTPALVATWAVLALLVGLLAAKAAGLVFLPAGSRKASIIALILAAALFHGDVIVSKDAAPTTVAVLTAAGGAVVAAPVLRRVHEHLTGRGVSFKDLFPTTLWARLRGEPSPAPLCLVDLSATRPRGPPRSPLFRA
jgi:hypothetical protein